MRRHNAAPNSLPEPEEIDIAPTMTADQIEAEMLHLKTLVVTDGRLQEIKRKLLITAEHRAGMLEDKTIDLRTVFPYFFSHGELVCN